MSLLPDTQAAPVTPYTKTWSCVLCDYILNDHWGKERKNFPHSLICNKSDKTLDKGLIPVDLCLDNKNPAVSWVTLPPLNHSLHMCWASMPCQTPGTVTKNAVVKQVRCDCFYSSEGHSQREKGQTAHKSEMMSENFEFNYFCKVFGNNLSLLLIAMWTNSAACITLKQMCNFQSAFLSFINKYALSKCLESTGLQYSNQMKQ